MEENKNEEFNNKENEELKGSINSENESKNEIGDETEKKENKILPIIVGVLAGIVAVAVFSLLIMSLLSPKNKYFSIVGKNFHNISKGIEEIENSALGEILGIDTNSKLALDLKMNGEIKTDDIEIREWVQNLENVQFNVNGNIDYSNDYIDTILDISLNNEKFLSGNLVKNKNVISAKVDDVTDGYISVNNNKLNELWEKIGINGPDSLDINILKELNFSKSEIKELKNAITAFASAFTTAFDDEDFSFGEGTVSYDEGNIECDTMDFFVDPQKFNNALANGLEKVISKEKYVDAFYNILATIDSISGYEPLSREEFAVNLESMLQQINSLEFSEEDEGFIVRIYYKGKDILKVEILSEDYNTKVLEFIAVNNNDSKYYKLYDGLMVYEDKVSTIENITTHLLTIDYINYETGEIEEGFGSEISIVIDDTVKNEQSINLTEKVRLLSYDEDLANLDIMTIDPTIIRNYTFYGKVDGDSNNFKVSLIDSDNTFSSTFSLEGNIIENAKFDYKVIDESENFETQKKSDDEIIAKKNKVIENWKATAGKDSKRVEQFETAVSMYISMIIPVDQFYGIGEYDEIDYSAIDLENLEVLE